MIKLLKKFANSCIVFVGLLLPYFVSADSIVTCEGRECNLCHLISTGHNALNWLVGILTILAVLLLIYAGFRLVTSAGNPQGRQIAKKVIVNVFVGYSIILASWLLIDAGMRILLRDGIANLGPWNEIRCVPQPALAAVNLNIPTEGFTDSWDLFLEGGPGTGWFDEDGEPLDFDGEGCDGIVEFAQQMMAQGCQYSQERRNGCQGNPGYTDCSDLVNISYRAAGCRSPGTYTGNQISNAQPIGNRSSLRRGDAIIWRSGGSGHTAICMNDGCSQIIEARGRQSGIVTGSSARMLNRSDIRVIRCQNFCN